MTERVNGYIIDDRLGFLMGDNAFVSIAVGPSALGTVASTGVLTPLAQFKALYAYDPSKDIGVNVAKTVDVGDGSNGTTMGAAVTVNEPNVVASLRKINGVPYADDEAYLKAWVQQENLKRLVDIVQQRAVLIAMSKAGAVTLTKAVTDVADATAAGRARRYGDWSSDMANGSVQSVVTFLVERGTAFDKARPNTYGQPGGIIIGQELVDELLKLELLYVDGTGSNAKVKSRALAAGDYAVKIDNKVPQIV